MARKNKGKYLTIFTTVCVAECVPVRWQEWAETSTQLEAVGSLAAHIHITTCQLLIGTYGELARHLVSPKLFTRCLTATQDIAIRLKEKEMVCETLWERDLE